MLVKELSEEVKGILKNAAQKMAGATRRAYLAEVTLELCEGNARQAVRWSPLSRQKFIMFKVVC